MKGMRIWFFIAGSQFRETTQPGSDDSSHDETSIDVDDHADQQHDGRGRQKEDQSGHKMSRASATAPDSGVRFSCSGDLELSDAIFICF